MRFCVVFLLFAAQQISAVTFTGHPEETWEGKRDESGIYSFKGLPFAAPPVGNLRWQPPKPYHPKGGGKLAHTFAPACMRADHIENWYRELIEKLGGEPENFEGPNGSSEDCLYLNVWTPTLEHSANLPVMVWIHGGSNKSGWAYEPDYRGNQLAKLDVVVISVAYRLGAFSMFALPSLIAEQQGSAANYGLLDLIAGLEFVRRHARAFGGNPDNVTLFGESAGAENIAALLASPRAQGLFHRAIHQSGSAMSSYRLEDVVRYSKALADGRTLDKLRSLSANEFYDLQSNDESEQGFGPVSGGHALPYADLYEALKSKPLLIGTNDHEWLMYLDTEVSLQETSRHLGITFTESEIRSKLASLSEQRIVDRLTTAKYMYCPTVKLGDRISSEQPTYFYLFTHAREGEYGQRVGAYHGAEIPYVFNQHDSYLVTTAEDLQLSKIIMGYWTNFARTGDPNAEGLSKWPKYNHNSKKVLNLGLQQTIEKARDLWMCE